MRRVLVFALLFALIAPLSTKAQIHDYQEGQTVVVGFPSKPLRKLPTSTSQVVVTVVEGDLLRIIDDGSIQADGLTWWNVETIDGNHSGWLADNVFSAFEEPVETEPSCWTADQAVNDSGVLSWTGPPAMLIDRDTTYIATIATTRGTIILELDAANAPLATNNFVCLADAGYYEHTTFHRISADFLIQGGDPTGTGTGTPGYVIPSDSTTGAYPEGSIALANSKPDENGSQFFIAVSDITGKIPGDYPVFGHVIAGQEVVAAISEVPVEPNSRGEVSKPVYPTTVISVEISRQDDGIGPPLPTSAPPVQVSPVPTVAAAPTVAIPPTTNSIIELDAKDIAFVPTEITINAADEPVTIRMKNTGAALHDFVIDSLNIKVVANPGETVDIIIPAGTAPGTYDFYCSQPGHKEAGMVGKLIVSGAASTSVSGQSPGSSASTGTCEGLATYQRAYENALLSTLLVDPEGATILSDWIDSDSELDSLTSIELASLSELFVDVVVALERVDPPPIASEWHWLQIERIRTLADFLNYASTVGPLTASLAYSSKVDRQDAAIERALTRASTCPQFVAWARDS